MLLGAKAVGVRKGKTTSPSQVDAGWVWRHQAMVLYGLLRAQQGQWGVLSLMQPGEEHGFYDARTRGSGCGPALRMAEPLRHKDPRALMLLPRPQLRNASLVGTKAAANAWIRHFCAVAPRQKATVGGDAFKFRDQPRH